MFRFEPFDRRKKNVFLTIAISSLEVYGLVPPYRAPMHMGLPWIHRGLGKDRITLGCSENRNNRRLTADTEKCLWPS
jgi:hypothetical protein